MSQVELIDALTEICTRQANIIRTMSFALSQYDAKICEEEAEWARRKLDELCPEWDDDLI